MGFRGLCWVLGGLGFGGLRFRAAGSEDSTFCVLGFGLEGFLHGLGLVGVWGLGFRVGSVGVWGCGFRTGNFRKLPALFSSPSSW